MSSDLLLSPVEILRFYGLRFQIEFGFKILKHIIGGFGYRFWSSLCRPEKMTSKQANLNREQRKKNLIGAFSVKKEAICRNRTILLLDDVMTTGATLSSAASVLIDAGAKNVKVLVLCRA